jgi:integrase
MEIYFKSVFNKEFDAYIELVKSSVVDHKAYQRTFADLDAFFDHEGLCEKIFDATLISRWLDTFNVKSSTKQSKLTHVRRFAGYLKTLGIKTDLPELPRIQSNFEPYVFTIEEISRLFEVADDLVVTKSSSRIAAELPVLLRILYGCGLRLGEALALTWDDVDLESGILFIRIAKNQKQRIVPMCEELTRILKLYKTAPCFETQAKDYLFKKDDGRPRAKNTFRDIFDSVLCELGIKNPQTAKPGERGPCLHSLRHTFVLHSFLKAEAEGRTFIETVPFLSTYLGHAGLLETEKYLKARHEMYKESHETIAAYTQDVFPEEI